MAATSSLCYVSSWTNESEELIPMWREYASVESGVRISLTTSPFKWVADTTRPTVSTDSVFSTTGTYNTRMSVADQLAQGVVCFTAAESNILYEVEYTNDMNKLSPAIRVSDNRFALQLLGKYKPKAWRYQKEWRYIHLAIPGAMINTPNAPTVYLDQLKMQLGGKMPMNMPDYLDFPLSDDAMHDMEITLAPKINAGFKLLVYDLVEKYCPLATIRESSLELA